MKCFERTGNQGKGEMQMQSIPKKTHLMQILSQVALLNHRPSINQYKRDTEEKHHLVEVYYWYSRQAGS